MSGCAKCLSETENDSGICGGCESEARFTIARADLGGVADLAMVLATEYHGRPADPLYVFGDATGGDVFVRMAEKALRFIALAKGLEDGHHRLQEILASMNTVVTPLHIDLAERELAMAASVYGSDPIAIHPTSLAHKGEIAIAKKPDATGVFDGDK